MLNSSYYIFHSCGYAINFKQFMRPRARGKRLSEEWVVPLRSLQDIYEVQLLVTFLHSSEENTVSAEALILDEFRHIRNLSNFVSGN